MLSPAINKKNIDSQHIVFVKLSEYLNQNKGNFFYKHEHFRGASKHKNAQS